MPKKQTAAAPATAPAAAPAAAPAVAPAAAPATAPAVPAVFYGVPAAQLTRSQAAIASAKRPAAVPAGLPATLRAGRPYRVGTGTNAVWWAAATGALAQAGGAATPAAIVQAGCPPSMLAYLYRRGYLQGA